MEKSSYVKLMGTSNNNTAKFIEVSTNSAWKVLRREVYSMRQKI